MGAKSWEVEIPGFIPPSVNRLLTTHWSKASRIKKKAANQVVFACMCAGVPMAKGKRRVGFTATVTNLSHAPDPDNLYKCLLDALKRAGAIVDDHSSYCELGQARVEKGKVRGTKIYLEDVE